MKHEKFFFFIIICYLLFVWSSSYTAVKIALSSFAPENLALIRFSVASIVLVILASSKKFVLPELKDIPTILLCGFLGITLYHLALNYGQTYVTAGSASMILNSYPIFVAIFSSYILKEYISPVKWFGIIISFIGIAFITIGESTVGLSPGVLFLLLAAISLSLFDVKQKKLLSKYSPLQLTSYFIWAGTLFLIFFSNGMVNDIFQANISAVLAAVYLGIFPGAISYLIWSKALSKYSVTAMSTLLYVVPPLTIIVAFFSLNEIPTITAIIGGITALTGVVIVNFSKQLKDIFTKNINRARSGYNLIAKFLHI